MLIGLRLLNEGSFIGLHAFEHWIRKERISLPSRGFGDMVLREPMDQIDVRSQEVADASDLLNDEAAVVHHELEVKRRESLTCFAGTGRLAVECESLLSKRQ